MYSGLDWKAARWIVENRGLKGVGQDAISIDYGQMLDFANSVHSEVLGANKPGFENLANVHRLPARGATIIALPMNVKYGQFLFIRIENVCFLHCLHFDWFDCKMCVCYSQ